MPISCLKSAKEARRKPQNNAYLVKEPTMYEFMVGSFLLTQLLQFFFQNLIFHAQAFVFLFQRLCQAVV